MLKKLAPYIGEFKKEAILSPVCIAIEVIMEVILPMLMAQVIDFGVNVGDMNYVLKMGWSISLGLPSPRTPHPSTRMQSTSVSAAASSGVRICAFVVPFTMALMIKTLPKPKIPIQSNTQMVRRITCFGICSFIFVLSLFFIGTSNPQSDFRKISASSFGLR